MVNTLLNVPSIAGSAIRICYQRLYSIPKDKFDAWYNAPRPKEGSDTSAVKTDSLKTNTDSTKAKK